jgi:hypothetical protein
MRWLKHLSMAHADKAIAFLLEEFGAEAYGVYWLMVEHIAAPMEPGKLSPVATHSVVQWAAICHCSVRVWRKFALCFAEKNLISLQSTENRWQIEIPKILKYKDEYSKKSRHTSDQEQMEIESRWKADTEEESSSSCCREASVGNVGITAPAAAPPPIRLPAEWECDATYAPLVAAWRAARSDAIDEDFALNHKYWKAFDQGQQEQALGHLRARVAAGLLNSSTLGYWLRVDWKRPVVVNGNGARPRAPDKNQKRREEVNAIAKLLRQ